MKILFQGDSITDYVRDKNNCHDMGVGYAKVASELIKEKYPDIDFEFVNLGYDGSKTEDLVKRLQTDFIDINPDIVSIMIGVNDVWHYSENRQWLDDKVFENNYRTVLEGIKKNTHAKILMMEPYLVPHPDKLFFREDFYKKVEIIRSLAREYADAYIPTDGLVASALVGHKPADFSNDGVHPSMNMGIHCLGKYYLDYISPIIEELAKQ